MLRLNIINEFFNYGEFKYDNTFNYEISKEDYLIILNIVETYFDYVRQGLINHKNFKLTIQEKQIILNKFLDVIPSSLNVLKYHVESCLHVFNDINEFNDKLNLLINDIMIMDFILEVNSKVYDEFEKEN